MVISQDEMMLSPNWNQSVRTSSPNSEVNGSNSSGVVADGEYDHVFAVPPPLGVTPPPNKPDRYSGRLLYRSDGSVSDSVRSGASRCGDAVMTSDPASMSGSVQLRLLSGTPLKG